MTDTLVRDWREETLLKVRESAKENRRSISAEVQTLVEIGLASKANSKPKSISLAELIRGEPVTNRSQAEIDAYVRDLRDEWDE